MRRRLFYLISLCVLFPSLASVKTLIAMGEWRVERESTSFLGYGAIGGKGTDWWEAAAYYESYSAMFDDRLTFAADGTYTFDPGADGLVAATEYFAALRNVNQGDGRYVVAASRQTASYTLTEKDGEVYLTLPANTLTPWLMLDDVYQSPRYRVYSISPYHMTLLYENAAGSITYRIMLTTLGNLPTKQEGEGTIAKNLWSDEGKTPFFYYADGNWSQQPDPEWSYADGSWSLYFPTANSAQWQAQMYFEDTGIALSSDKQYAIKCTVTTNKDVPMTVRIDADGKGNWETVAFDKRVTVPAGEDYVFNSGVWAGLDIENAFLVFDFGGCAADTRVTIKDIELGEAVEQQPELSMGKTFTETIDGVEVLFRVTDGEKKTCQVGKRLYDGDGTWGEVSAVDSDVDFTLDIPSEVRGYTVTAIGEAAFAYDRHLKGITLPSTVTVIGNGAFYATSLEEIDIPGSVVFADASSFSARTWKHIGLNEGLRVLAGNPWNVEADGLTLPSTLMELGAGWFHNGCTMTSLAETPPTVLYDGTSLYGTPGTLYVPKGAKAAYEVAPVWCEFDKIFEIGNEEDTGEHSHGYFTEANADGVEISYHILTGGKCEVGRRVTAYDWSNYDEESYLAYLDDLNAHAAAIDTSTEGSLTIPETVAGLTVVGLADYALFGCSGLTDITLPATTMYALNYALGASNVKSLRLPAAMQNVWPNTFTCLEKGEDGSNLYVTKLERIEVDPANTTYEVQGNTLIEKDGKKVVRGFDSSVIPKGVETIGGDAFYCCRELEQIVVPEGVKWMEWAVFTNCSKLAKVVLPSTLQSMVSGSLGYCTSLSALFCHAQTPPAITNSSDPDLFDIFLESDLNPYASCTLYVPEGTRDLYASADGWRKFDTIVELSSVELTPLDEATAISMESLLADAPDLSNAVVGNVYFNLDAATGSGYDAEEQCLVLATPMEADAVEAVEGMVVGSDELRGQYCGLIFEVPAGQGKVSVTAQAGQGSVLGVKVASQAARHYTLDGKQTISFDYEVAAPTYVYVYAVDAAASAQGLPLAPSADGVRVYGFAWAPITDGISLSEADAAATPWYTLQGQRVERPRRGVYIHGGRKVVVK